MVLFLVVTGITSCRRNRYKINTSGIDASVNIKRLEQDLYSGSPNEIPGKIPFLKNKYDGFLQLFSYVINIGKMDDSAWSTNLVKFCTDKQNYEVYTTTMQIFPDIKEIEKSLTDAFRHYLHYFPDKKIPGVYTCITGFNNSIITGDSSLGISLDRYLGSGCKYYPQLQLYKYQMFRMNPSNIIPDCMSAWASSEWDYRNIGYNPDNVLAEMIHQGKLLYFVKCMVPEIKEDLVFGFTPGQLMFCVNNENQMWKYLIENNLLFNTDQLTKRKLTEEAPFTSYFSKESPGRAAVWIGFRIVESYMWKNKDSRLEDLMINADYQGILEKARYNPQ